MYVMTHDYVFYVSSIRSFIPDGIPLDTDSLINKVTYRQANQLLT